MEEGRKRVLGIMPSILASRHLKTTEDMHDSRPSPGTESLTYRVQSESFLWWWLSLGKAVELCPKFVHSGFNGVEFLVDCTQLGPNRVLECLFRTACHIRFRDSGLNRLWISRNKRGGILSERNQPISLSISKQAPTPDYKMNEAAGARHPPDINAKLLVTSLINKRAAHGQEISINGLLMKSGMLSHRHSPIDRLPARFTGHRREPSEWHCSHSRADSTLASRVAFGLPYPSHGRQSLWNQAAQSER